MECAVGADSYSAGYRRAGDKVGCPRVEFLQNRSVRLESSSWDFVRAWLNKGSYLAKVHRLNTLTSQGWTNRRTGRGLAGSDYKLHNLVDAAGAASF